MSKIKKILQKNIKKEYRYSFILPMAIMTLSLILFGILPAADCPKPDFGDIRTYIAILKFAFIGAFVSVYLRRSRYTNLTGTMNVALSVIYALGSFCFKSFSEHIYIDNTMLLPLVLLGVEQVFERRRIYMLLPCLMLCIAAGPRSAFVTLLFSSVYFLFYFVVCTRRKSRGNLLISLLLCSLCVLSAGGIFAAAFLSIPRVYYEYLAVWYMPKDPLAAITGMMFAFCGRNADVRGYVGVLPFFLTILFFINKDIGHKEKVLALGYTVLAAASLFITPVLPLGYRGGGSGDTLYAAAFLLTMLSGRCLSSLHVSDRKLLLIPCLSLFIAALIFTLRYPSNITTANLCLIFTLLALYTKFTAFYMENTHGKGALSFCVIAVIGALVFAPASCFIYCGTLDTLHEFPYIGQIGVKFIAGCVISLIFFVFNIFMLLYTSVLKPSKATIPDMNMIGDAIIDTSAGGDDPVFDPYNTEIKE